MSEIQKIIFKSLLASYFINKVKQNNKYCIDSKKGNPKPVL